MFAAFAAAIAFAGPAFASSAAAAACAFAVLAVAAPAAGHGALLKANIDVSIEIPACALQLKWQDVIGTMTEVVAALLVSRLQSHLHTLLSVSTAWNMSDLD